MAHWISMARVKSGELLLRHLPGHRLKSAAEMRNAFQRVQDRSAPRPSSMGCLFRHAFLRPAARWLSSYFGDLYCGLRSLCPGRFFRIFLRVVLVADVVELGFRLLCPASCTPYFVPVGRIARSQWS